MTLNGWLQILFFSACVLLVAKPLGLYLVRVYDGSLTWLAPVERAIYRVCGVDRDEDQHWTRYAGGMLLFSVASMLLTYLVLRLQHVLPLNPQHLRGGDRPPGVRDVGVVHDEHELAVVRRRVDDVVLLADDAARVSQLRVGGGRHGGGRRVRARHRAQVGGPARQLLGRSHARHALRAAAALARRSSLLFVQQGVIQNFKPYLDVTTLEGAKQTIAMGPVASQESDQAARHERRRLLQRQRGASVRESDAVDQLLVDVHDLHDPVGADVHARPDGEEPEARLGGVGGDVRAVLRRRDDRLLGRGARQSDSRGARHRRRDARRPIPAATWKARRFASASRTPRSTPR